MDQNESASQRHFVVERPREPGGDTRERILEIALELFVAKGYEKTSLREIAEQLGFSKAAIYYHFASKDAILMALHYRLHEIGKEAFGAIEPTSMTLAAWAELLYEFIDLLLGHRVLFIMHERNRAALEQLHNQQHEEDHSDLEAFFRHMLADESLPLRDRVRVTCAFGAVMIGLVMTGDAFANVPDEELKENLRSAVSDLLLD